jgi:hypothetical protein
VSSRRHARGYWKIAGPIWIRLPGCSTVLNKDQYRTSTGRVQGMTEGDRYWDTADRQNITGGRIAKKIPRDRIQNTEDKIFSLCDVTNNCSSAWWKTNKSNYQIWNTLITFRVTRIHATILKWHLLGGWWKPWKRIVKGADILRFEAWTYRIQLYWIPLYRHVR